MPGMGRSSSAVVDVVPDIERHTRRPPSSQCRDHEIDFSNPRLLISSECRSYRLLVVTCRGREDCPGRAYPADDGVVLSELVKSRIHI